MRRCVLVLAAAAAFDEVPFELRDVYGPVSYTHLTLPTIE